MDTRCKFQVSEIARMHPASMTDPKAKSFRLKAYAVYDDGLCKENKTFSSATPSGDLMIFVTNPAVYDLFDVGDYIYLDLTKVPKPPPAA